MNTPESKPDSDTVYENATKEPDGTFIPVRAIPEDELRIDTGLRGGPDRRTFVIHSGLYGHRGYAEAKGRDD